MIRLIEFEKISFEVWDALLARLSSPSPFLSRLFLVPWCLAFCSGQSVRVVAWFPSGDTPEGLLFLRRLDYGGWTFLGGENVTDYFDAIVTPGGEEAFWREFLEEGLPALGGGPLLLPGLAEDTPSHVILPRLCEEAGLSCLVEEMDQAPYVSLPGSFEDYLALLGQKERHELRRKMRRAAEQLPGLSFRLTMTEGEFMLDMRSFIDLHRKSAPGKEKFMDDQMAAFFHEVASGFFRAGMLRLAFLSSEGEDIAAALQFRAGRSVLLYNSGYDPRRRSANPGLVLIARCIESAIEEGAVEYDFLRGTERYKYDLGGRDRAVRRVTVAS
ncbi:MAG: GNAT family N-acetyltransferase [Syntrophorhabdaceae bacterium]|nr:GNAT family N-acetyltransferase [Syntrophorhabdaceae bacterium]